MLKAHLESPFVIDLGGSVHPPGITLRYLPLVIQSQGGPFSLSLSLSLSLTHTHTHTHTHTLSRQECGILIYLGNLVKSTSQPVFSSGHSFIIISSFSIVSYPLYLPTLEVSSSLRNELLLVRPITEFYYIHTHMSYRFYISGES